MSKIQKAKQREARERGDKARAKSLDYAKLADWRVCEEWRRAMTDRLCSGPAKARKVRRKRTRAAGLKSARELRKLEHELESLQLARKLVAPRRERGES